MAGSTYFLANVTVHREVFFFFIIILQPSTCWLYSCYPFTGSLVNFKRRSLMVTELQNAPMCFQISFTKDQQSAKRFALTAGKYKTL